MILKACNKLPELSDWLSILENNLKLSYTTSQIWRFMALCLCCCCVANSQAKGIGGYRKSVVNNTRNYAALEQHGPTYIDGNNDTKHVLSSRSLKDRSKLRNSGKACREDLVYSEVVNHRSWREQQIACKLLRDYNWNIRPKGSERNAAKKDGGPVHVITSLFINAISSVSDTNMQFTAQFRFQQEWHDERLSYAHLKFRELDWVDLAVDQKIWNPDTFFQNEKSGHLHMIDRPNVYTRIRYDGYVIYNKRMTMKFACNMNLKRYPHDTQTCHIDFASYAYTTEDIEYVWPDNRAVVITPEATGSLPKFLLGAVQNGSCTSITNTGTYSCLRVTMRMTRVFSFYLLQLYIPSVMLVSVSYVSYWIDWRASPARVPLSIVTLLTMVTQSHVINSNLPPVSYTKAIDVWISGCIVFIFGSLLEYAVVNYTGIKEEHRRLKARLSTEVMLVKESTQREQDFLQQLGQIFGTASQAPEGIAHNNAHMLRDHRLSLRPERFEVLEGMHETSVLFGPQTACPHPTTAVRRRRWMNGVAASRRYQATRFQSLQDLGEGGDSYSELDVKIAPVRLRGHRREINLFRSCNFVHTKGRAERIDLVSRMLVPLLFLGFNCVYWVLYWQW